MLRSWHTREILSSASTRVNIKTAVVFNLSLLVRFTWLHVIIYSCPSAAAASNIAKGRETRASGCCTFICCLPASMSSSARSCAKLFHWHVTIQVETATAPTTIRSNPFHSVPSKSKGNSPIEHFTINTDGLLNNWLINRVAMQIDHLINNHKLGHKFRCLRHWLSSWLGHSPNLFFNTSVGFPQSFFSVRCWTFTYPYLSKLVLHKKW